MSQSTSESVSNYESIESNDSFVSAKSDCEDSSAVDQTMNKFKAITGSKEENNVEPRCSCSHKEPSGGIEKHSLDSINGKDSNPKSNGESEHSLNVAFEHSVRIDAVDVKHSNSASNTKLGSDDVVPVDSGARSLNVTLDHPGHIDGSGLVATGDDTISNSGNVGGVEGDSVTAADLPDVTTNSDDESNVNEEDDVDPDWSTYYSDEEDEENDDDDYEEDGMGSRMDFDDYPYTDSEDDDDHLIDGFEINDSIREAIENEMVERYTFKFKFQHRSSVSDDSVDVCAVCLVSFVDSEEVRRLPCFHLFHTGCVDPWLKKHKRVCPKCRLSINKASDYLNESAR